MFTKKLFWGRHVSLGDMVLLSLGLYLFVPSMLLSFSQMPLMSRIWLKAFAGANTVLFGTHGALPPWLLPLSVSMWATEPLVLD